MSKYALPIDTPQFKVLFAQLAASFIPPGKATRNAYDTFGIPEHRRNNKHNNNNNNNKNNNNHNKVNNNDDGEEEGKEDNEDYDQSTYVTMNL